jgi:plasmid maintenance system antidote protein VapI
MSLSMNCCLFGNTAEFWLNIQHAVVLWDIKNGAYQNEFDNIKVLS